MGMDGTFRSGFTITVCGLSAQAETYKPHVSRIKNLDNKNLGNNDDAIRAYSRDTGFTGSVAVLVL